MASVWARVQVGSVERVVEVTEDAKLMPVPFFAAVARELGAPSEGLKLTYLDDEGDWCRLITTADMEDAMAMVPAMNPPLLHIRVKVPGGHASVAPADVKLESKEEVVPAVARVAAARQARAERNAAVRKVVDAAVEALDDSWSGTLKFVLNGNPVEIVNPDPKLLLVDYIRNTQLLRGTKKGCGEGGCGACTVLLTWTDASGTVHNKSINSCLRLLCSMEGMAVTTVEKVGNRKAGFHPTQERLASCNGSQCGFCSVGQVMNMYGLLKDNPDGLTASEIENKFDGNLCRCTGYRPIMTAFKTFATSGDSKNSAALTHVASSGAGSGAGAGAGTDSPISEAAMKEHKDNCGHHEEATGMCSKTGVACTGDCARNHASLDIEDMFEPYNPAKHDPEVPDLSAMPKRSLVFRGKVTEAGTAPTWFRPTTLADLLTVQKSLLSLPAETVKLVVGNTAMGVSKYYQSTPYDYQVYVDVSQVAEFQTTTVDATTGITAGAAVTIDQLIQLCNQADPDSPTQTNSPTADNNATTATSTFAALGRHLCRVANTQVRGVASWTGNLMLAAHHTAFPSDVAVSLATVGATVSISSGGKVTTGVSILDLLSTCATDNIDTLVLSLSIPAGWGKAAPSSTTSYTAVDSFKVAQRHQNAHPIVNAGFCLTVDASAGTITTARAIFGGVGKVIFEATSLEAALTGKTWSDATLQAALTALTADITRVGDSTAFGQTPAYRRQLAAAFLYKFALRCQPSLPATLQSAAQRYVRPVSKGVEVYTPDPTTYPISQPIVKESALDQTSGEAVYTFDVKPPADGLYGVFAYTTQATGTLATLDTTDAAAAPGVVAVLDATDVVGKNDCGINPGEEQLFLPIGGTVGCIGQSLCLVVADTPAHATAAAKLVTSTYTAATGGAAPVVTIDQAVAAKSFFSSDPSDYGGYLASLSRGNASTAMPKAANTATGSITTLGQRHFYMETQNAIAFPIEGCKILRVESSSQSMDQTQLVIKNVTNLPANAINVGMRRAGGSFGGKISRSLHVAAGAGLAAFVLNRCVHVRLDRTADLDTVAGREALNCNYTVGFSDDGVITALEMTIYNDSGYIIDTSFGDIDMAQLWADNCYYIANYASTATVCKTNKPTTTSMRAPGVVQSVLCMETVIERVACELGMDAMAVRQANFYHLGNTTPYGQTIKYMSLPTIWSDIQTAANYKDTLASVQAFNKANRWRKRGISITPIKYGIGDTGYTQACMLRVYPSDGTVNITHGGMEVGQGINTKVAQVVAATLKCPLSLIRVTTSDTNRVSTSSITGGSGTSETCCAAALDACNILNGRLADLRKAMPTATWAQLAAAASGQLINLACEGWYNPTPSSSLANEFTYYVWAAAQSVVEIDVLTGQLEILSSFIYYDCGVSLNPDIDIGQVEGAFIMGVGYFFTEQVAYDQSTGEFLSTGTWNYKPPFPLDIPQSLNVTLLKDAPNPVGILRSKATGEPPYSLANSAFFAVKNALMAARADAGTTGWFQLPVPATVDQIGSNGAVDPSKFSLEA